MKLLPNNGFQPSLIAKRYKGWFKGVPEARKNELEKYQLQISKVRESYQTEFREKSANLMSEPELKRKNRIIRERKWDFFIKDIKAQLRNPASHLYRDRHSCRPIYKREKSSEQRINRLEKFSSVLLKHKMEKRRFLFAINEDLKQNNIDQYNLDEAIEVAISYPSKFSIPPETMVSKYKQTVHKVKKYNIPAPDISSQSIYICRPHEDS